MSGQVVTIDSLAFGGNGVCRIDGKVCFVPFSCPGDKLRLTVTSEKRSYLTARITEILTPSEQRVTPPCPLFGSCGGCSWQHIGYARQLQAKRQILAETLWRGARVDGERILPALPSPSPYGYRSRVQFKLHSATDRLYIGFFRSGSHRVEDAPGGCPVALAAVNAAIGQLRAVLESCAECSRIPQINVECGDTGAVAIVNYIGTERDTLCGHLLLHRTELSSLSGLWLQSGRKSTLTRVWGDDRLYYALPSVAGSGDVRLGFAPGCFSQVNRDQNRAMLDIVRRMARFQATEQVLDLYCGNGNFSLPIAGAVSSVTGIEEYAGSIVAAEENRSMNRIAQADFICDDAAGGVRKLAQAGRSFDTVILDPPRSGAADVVTELHRLNPAKIIYVSCDPSTLARDCGVLAGNGYRVQESAPVDMFPQTYHIESVTLLVK
jgi:23S rRNA (uracil1939-C5)-methyltransferase